MGFAGLVIRKLVFIGRGNHVNKQKKGLADNCQAL
jgi:hypothetical protein